MSGGHDTHARDAHADARSAARDALCRLAGVSAIDGDEAATAGAAERWAATARRAGHVAGADLLAELVEACLADGGPAARRAALADLPRPFEHVVADLAALQERLVALDAPLPLDALPELDTLDRRAVPALALARASLDALYEIEGESRRHVGLSERCG